MATKAELWEDNVLASYTHKLYIPASAAPNQEYREGVPHNNAINYRWAFYNARGRMGKEGRLPELPHSIARVRRLSNRSPEEAYFVEIEPAYASTKVERKIIPTAKLSADTPQVVKETMANFRQSLPSPPTQTSPGSLNFNKQRILTTRMPDSMALRRIDEETNDTDEDVLVSAPQAEFEPPNPKPPATTAGLPQVDYEDL